MVIQQGLLKLKIHDTIYTVGNDVPPETSLNEYIRNYANLKGTKFMCLEGGCGACIVAIKRPNLITGKEEIIAVNSCLVPIFSCYGWSIITVEGIGNRRNGYHKVQSTLAGFSGTQCGYCTPGMVMNMFSLLNGDSKITMSDVENSFGGNICRCTGYRPILDAFKSLASDATPELKKTCTDIEDIMSQMKICSKTQQPCENLCKTNGSNGFDDDGDLCDSDKDTQIPDVSFSMQLQGSRWFRVKSIQEIYDVFEMVQDNTKYMLVGGNTAHGVYRSEPQDIYIDINGVKDLHTYTLNSDKLVLGANMTLNKTIEVLNKVAAETPNKFGYLKQMASHIDLIANVPVRNVGTLAGNLSIKYFHREFPSDLFLMLETVDAQLTIGHMSGMVYSYPLAQYFVLDMRRRVILNITLPALDSSTYVYSSYKIMQRAQNTHAYVNAGFLVKVDKNAYYRVLDSPSIVFGGISPQFVHATNTENYIKGKNLLEVNTLKEACRILKSELKTDNDPLEAAPEYRVSLAVNLFYKFILSLSPNTIDSKYRSGGSLLTRPLSSGKQDFQTDKSKWPVTKPMPKLEAFAQCSGEAEYVNDIPVQVNELYGAFVVSKKGPGKLTSIDTSAIRNIPGVVKFVSAKDIPGKNTFVEVYKVEDEQLFADKEILYAGQPVGVVVAKTQILANKAADKVIVNVEQTRKPVLDFKAVVDSGDKNRITVQAEKQATTEKKDVKYKFNGSLLMGGQYHFTMETQTCYCVPTEDGMDMYPATQWITGVQQNAAVALNLPENSINVSVKRCGGGYGSKLGRSALVSTACAVAAHKMKVPVRMVVKLETNMEAVGKRFPMYGKYEVAVNEKGKIQRLIIDTYTDKGVTLNEPLLDGLVSHIQNCYDATTWKITAYDVRTDYTTNTYARAPGSTEGVALIECIMNHIASVTNLDPTAVRLANLNMELSSSIPPMIDDIKQTSDLMNRLKSVEDFNKANRWKKRGISLVTMTYPYVVPVPYHILMSVYMYDGSVAISHGGIEIGQGINTKVVQAVAYTLGIDVTLIKIKPSMALTSPNDGPTGGSFGSDGVTFAALECCKILLSRLEPIKQKNPGKSWPEIIAAAAAENVDLMCEYMYSPTATNINYNIFGVAVSEVEVDLLTGQYLISRVDLLEDVGQSISPDVDIGQVEGAFIMGMGYWLSEKLIYDQNSGALLTNRSWNYTPPGAKDIPADFRVYFRRNAPNSKGVLRSKATGEPPLCLSIGTVFAIRNALLSGRKDAGSKDDWFQINLPYTPENVLLSSMTSLDQFAL
ncbi:uncharacterized protein LOC135848590 isoform X2 [Planococcus citri]|uniref:uncharacterized protein LOC135848590 isoform X2 n=1 Tax=Planococcus citri TaxID=170843 RepID=UPI0031F7CA0A